MKKVLILFPILLLLLLQLIYIAPIFEAFHYDAIRSIGFDFISNLLFTILNALVSVFVIIVISFYFSIILANATNTKIWITFLLIPALLGNVAVSYFLSRVQIFDFFSEDRSVIGVYVPLLLTNLYQYGSLAVFLFYIKIKDIPNEVIQFGNSNGYNLKEKTREIYLPQLQKIIILLSIMLFIFIFNEFSKITILFRSSPATNTELISHLIDRLFRLDLTNRTDLAITNLLNQSLFITFTFIAISIPLFFIKSKKVGISVFSNVILLFFFLTKIIRPKVSIVIFALLVASIFFPIIKIIFDFRIPDVSILADVFFKTLPLYLFTSILIASYFIICSIHLKLLFPFQLSLRGKNYHKYIWGLFIYRVIPAISIGYLGFVFFKIFSINKYLFWIIGQTILVAPIILTFLIYTHIELSQETVYFTKRHKFSYIEILKSLFYRSYKLPYLLVVLFTFCFIWNDDTLTYAIRMHVPTPIVDLINNSIGKSLNRSDAAYALLPLFLIIIAFLYYLNKMSRSKIKDKHAKNIIERG